MKHTHHAIYNEPWTAALIIGIAVIIIILLVWFIYRRRVTSDGLSPKERKELSSEQKQILSMLRQYGEPMMQKQLVDILQYDLEDAVEILKEMESKGLIMRSWNSEQSTYEITLV
jgi:DNA-binding MarR family transcriptional regulator